jgi:hypothetical protein
VAWKFLSFGQVNGSTAAVISNAVSADFLAQVQPCGCTVRNCFARRPDAPARQAAQRTLRGMKA